MTTVEEGGATRRSWLRTHAFFLLALAAGIAVRVMVAVAYRPVLLFTDSFRYLKYADHGTLDNIRPSGYSLFLQPFVGPTATLLPVSVIQHLLGLALAVACYAFLVRRGVPSWGATLAMLPLLLDPLQLVLEHYVLSDVLFEVLLVGACLVLLWRRRPGLGTVLLAGLMVAGAGLMRGAGSFLLPVFVVALVCLRVRWTKLAAFVIALVVPTAVYAAAFHAQYGVYALSDWGPRFLYGRLAPVVSCHDVVLPRDERPLCPPQPVGQRPSTDWYVWAGRESPQWYVRIPQGKTRPQMVKDFDKRVVRAQPVVYTKAVLADAARGFAPVRTYDVPGYPSSYWRFADHYWTLDTFIARGEASLHSLRGTSYSPRAAEVMTAYGRWVYTPGPVMAVLLVIAVAAMLGFGRARASRNRVAIGLLTGACLVPLLTGAALSGFSWRYQLPQIPLLPMAGALGLVALVSWRRAPDAVLEPPAPVLDQVAGRVARLPMPSRWRTAADRAAQHGWLQVAIGLLAAIVAAGLGAAVAAASGWFRPDTAAFGGVLFVGLVLVTLLVARRRRSARPSD